MKAAGAYLKHLREHLRLSQAEVARRAGASSSQMNRIENGQGETRATLVAAVVVALGADPEDVIRLLADEGATVETGRALVLKRLHQGGISQQNNVAVRPEISSLISQMTEFQLGRWVAMGERMIEERP